MKFHNQLKSFSALSNDAPLSLLLVLIKVSSQVLPLKHYVLIPFRRDEVRYCDEKYKQITTYYITKDSSSGLISSDEKIRLDYITSWYIIDECLDKNYGQICAN